MKLIRWCLVYTQLKRLMNPQDLMSEIMPTGIMGRVGEAIRSVPCLKKETEEQGFLFGFGVDGSGVPSVTIQCRRLSCYHCLAKSTWRLHPFTGMANRAYEFLVRAINNEASTVLGELFEEYEAVQESILQLAEVEEGEIVEQDVVTEEQQQEFVEPQDVDTDQESSDNADDVTEDMLTAENSAFSIEGFGISFPSPLLSCQIVEVTSCVLFTSLIFGHLYLWLCLCCFG